LDRDDIGGRKREVAFEKAPQNFFALGCRAVSTPREAEQKFFGYFFSKK
jgi:hypothetical protein